MKRRKGSYAGTKTEGGRRCKYSRELLFSSAGIVYTDENNMYFEKTPSGEIITIPLRSIKGFEKGKFHCGKWLFNSTIVKIIWEDRGMRLKSGFVFSRREFETELAVQEIKNAVETAKKGFTA
ncbi:MAG: hypothetical protein ACLFP1_03200 [Candidatus Goldiibacteriota bacterium]